MCRNGPVSSSITGPTPKTRVYQASLTDRSVTVTATCEMAGKVPEMATMIVLCSLWRLITPQRYEPPLPRTFPAPAGPGKAREDGDHDRSQAWRDGPGPSRARPLGRCPRPDVP